MKIKIIGHDGKVFKQPNSTNPWNVFHQHLLDAGHSIIEEKDQHFDVLIANSYSKIQIEFCEKNKIPINNRFLILWEPRQTNPQIYSKQHISKYGTIFSPSQGWIHGEKVIHFNWPQGSISTDKAEYDLWKSRKNKSIMIASNKYSFIEGEQYSLRRSVVSAKSAFQVIDVAGHDWDLKLRILWLKIAKSLWRSKGKNFSINSCTNLIPQLRNYIGSVESKNELSSNFRVALVIENSSDYVSEKLFDALNSQNIVVYVGPELTHFGLSDRMAVRVKPKLNCIVSKLKNVLLMSEREQFKLLTGQQSEYKRIASEWNNRFVLENIAKDIAEKIISKSTT